MAVAACLMAAAASAQATTTLYWAGGSSGAWDNTTQNWSTSNGGSANSAWVNGDAAQFGSVTTASINANVSAAQLNINADTTLTGSGAYTLTVANNNPAAGGAGQTLAVNGANVDFSTGYRGGAPNLELDSGTITIGGAGSNFDPSSKNWALTVNGGTLDASGATYGLRLGSASFNGSGEDATGVQNAGTVTIGGQGLQIGTGPGSTAATSSTAVSYTLNGGTLGLTHLNFGAVANSSATFNLAGGVVTVNTNTIAFDTGSSVGTEAFNFVTGNGTPGTLVLKNSSNTSGDWNFTSLTGITNSSFLVNGVAATSSDLSFASDPTLTGYTDISVATTPEPSTLAMFVLGTVGLGMLGLRRNATRR